MNHKYNVTVNLQESLNKNLGKKDANGDVLTPSLLTIKRNTAVIEINSPTPLNTEQLSAALQNKYSNIVSSELSVNGVTSSTAPIVANKKSLLSYTVTVSSNKIVTPKELAKTINNTDFAKSSANAIRPILGTNNIPILKYSYTPPTIGLSGATGSTASS